MHGVSKKFGEAYRKTNETKDINKFSLLSFKIVAIRYQHTFDNIRTASANTRQRPPVVSIAGRLSHDL